MALESLLQLLETLSQRIDKHGAALKQSETLTRYALVDPLLRELGWDTADPTMVVPEDGSGNGRADYLLQADGKPCMVIEAKRLGRIPTRRSKTGARLRDGCVKASALLHGNEWQRVDDI